MGNSQLSDGPNIFVLVKEMNHHSPSDFPLGAKRVEFLEMWIAQGKGKLMIGDITDLSEHVTLNLSTQSDIVDVHRTWMNEKKERQDLTLFAIKSSDLLRGLREASMALPLIFPRLRVLRPIGIHRHAMVFQSVPNLDSSTGEEFWLVGSKRTAYINTEKLSNRMNVTESIQEVYQSSESLWYIWTTSRLKPRLLGIAFRSAGPGAAAQRIRWIALRDLETFIQNAQLLFIDMLRKYEIPKGEYGKYSFLTPPP